MACKSIVPAIIANVAAEIRDGIIASCHIEHRQPNKYENTNTITFNIHYGVILPARINVARTLGRNTTRQKVKLFQEGNSS